jgi:hypothetical protein
MRLRWSPATSTSTSASPPNLFSILQPTALQIMAHRRKQSFSTVSTRSGSSICRYYAPIPDVAWSPKSGHSAGRFCFGHSANSAAFRWVQLPAPPRAIIRSTELENPKVLRPEIGDQYRTRFGHDRGANEALPCRIQGSVQGAEVLAIGRNDGGLPIHVVNRLLIYYPLVPTTA